MRTTNPEYCAGRANPFSHGSARALIAVTITALLYWCGAPARADSLAWQSGFEDGFPGSEWLDFDDGSYSPSGSTPPGRTSAWTIVSRRSGEPVFSGDHAYKGWITGQSGSSHRAYPGIHTDIVTPVVNTFMVYLDTRYDRMVPDAWIHLGTWGNYDPGTQTGEWALHTMAVRNRKLEFAHVSPFHGEYIGPENRTDFPLRRWVRITVYLAYQGNEGFVQAWQDGVPVLRAAVSRLGASPGTRLRTAHWGMYASGSVDQGVQYNDDIRICTLARPLADFTREPQCPSGPATEREAGSMMTTSQPVRARPSGAGAENPEARR